LECGAFPPLLFLKTHSFGVQRFPAAFVSEKTLLWRATLARPSFRKNKSGGKAPHSKMGALAVNLFLQLALRCSPRLNLGRVEYKTDVSRFD